MSEEKQNLLLDKLENRIEAEAKEIFQSAVNTALRCKESFYLSGTDSTDFDFDRELKAVFEKYKEHYTESIKEYLRRRFFKQLDNVSDLLQRMVRE